MYSPPKLSLAALGPLKPKILRKTCGPIIIKGRRGFDIETHLFLVRRGICVQCFMPLAQTGPEIWAFESFQLVALAPPMDASRSNHIAFIFVPPFTPPPSLVWIGGLVLELSWWRSSQHDHTTIANFFLKYDIENHECAYLIPIQLIYHDPVNHE